MNRKFLDLPQCQQIIHDWMFYKVGHPEQWDIINRSQRLLEEALEAVQTTGLSRLDAHKLVEYVYNRPIGYTPQEIGGTAVCLLALSDALKLDFEKCLHDEMDRIHTPHTIQKVRDAIVRKHNDGVGI